MQVEGTPDDRGWILVVDDEETVRRAVQKRLEKAGYRVISLDNAKDALKVFESIPFDAVITDIRMQEMDGIQLLQRIRRLREEVPVILITGDPSLGTARESVKLGAFDYITKPVQKETLLQAVRHAVERKRLSERLARYQEELEHRVEEQTRLIRALFELTNRLNSMDRLEDVLLSVVHAVHRHAMSERVGIYLVAEEPQVLLYAAGFGPQEPSLRGTRLPLSAPLVQDALEGRGVFVVTSGEGPRPEHPLSSMGPLPWLVGGLRHSKRPVGIIIAAEPAPGGSYGEHEKEILRYIGDAASVAIHNQLVSQRLQESYLNIIQALAYAIEAKDPYTRGHSERVRQYALRLAERLDLPQEERLAISYAAVLHDIGKVEISPTILQKPGRLTQPEISDIKHHPALGEVMVEGISFLDMVRPFIRHHHERWDGQGYPDGLQGEEIPLGARIIAVADTYDALTSSRPYRPNMSKERAILQLREAKGSQLDPRLVEEFIGLILHIP